MELSKRASLGLTGLLSVLLAGIVVRDVVRDWLVENKPLWSTLLENVVPLGSALAVLAAGYLVYQRRDERFMTAVTRWQYIGTAGLLVVAAEVVGAQVIQGELKPWLIVLQITIGGAVAGTLVGYATARSEVTRETARRERDKFEALFENAPAEVVEVVLAGGEPVVVEQNAAFAEMFGTEGDSPAGDPLFETVSHDEETRAVITGSLRAGEEDATRLHTATANGQRDFQLRVVPFRDSERGYLLYTDITELSTTKAELEATVGRLERSNERLQQFAYVASHDLQEPARMVSSYISLLETEYGDQFDEDAHEYMDFAIDGADRMQAMIDGLLDYSRVRTQGEEFTETDAGEVFADTMRDLELLREEHDATVTCDDLPTVEADRNQLGQVFQNLVENAIEHGGDGTTIHVGAERREDDVRFSVADDGPGIPENRQDRVFEIFEQGSRDSDGTGIGLAICDRIVSRHGGEMWVESSEGEGATFYFTIPT
ncbi:MULTISPECIES: sensor histidine kinase [Salinibaculum]|uniref:sensor histidine kinase n=1 Tax=Salinibaculum TaxID=2732368 RepID=UPI0030CDB2E3